MVLKVSSPAASVVEDPERVLGDDVDGVAAVARVVLAADDALVRAVGHAERGAGAGGGIARES